MPPQDALRPEPATYDSFATWLASALDAAAEPNPGAPALRRLNRAEYANAIRDLLDLEVDVNALLPPDDSAFGFDNIGDLLVFSPTLLERYLSAADRVSAMAVGDPNDRGRRADVHGQRRRVASDAARRAAARHRRRRRRHARVSARRRIRVRPRAVPQQPRRDSRARAPARARNRGRRPARVSGRRRRRARGQPSRHDDQRAIGLHRRAPHGPRSGRGRPENRDGSLHSQARRRHEPPAAVRAQQLRHLRRHRPAARRDADDYRPLHRDRPRRHAEPAPHLHLLARRRRRRAAVRARDSVLARSSRLSPARGAGDIDRLMPFFEEGRANGGFETGIQLALRRILASPSFAFRIEAEPESPASATSYAVSDIGARDVASRSSSGAASPTTSC